MELLCVLAAVAALFCGCAVLTLKCRVPASVAPLTALSAIVAVLTLAAMAGVLYPAAWLLYLLCLAGGVWVAASCRGSTGAAQRLFTPGSVLFWGMALAFTVYFFVRQPMATDFDELSLWATAVKITKVNDSLYATAELGTPWAATQNPGLPLLAYFFQFFGDYADWKIYVGYDILYFSVFAAVVGAVPREKWRVAVPMAAVLWCVPFFFTNYNHTIYLTTTYMTSYGDVPAGLVFGGAVAAWLALRQNSAPKWAVLPILALSANIKANTFVLALVAAGLVAVDEWLFADDGDFKAGLLPRTGFSLACFAAPMAIYYLWNVRYVGWLVSRSASDSGVGETSAPLSAVVVNGIKILLGQPVEGFYAEREAQFRTAMADMGHQFWTSDGKLSMIGQGRNVVALIAIVFAVAILAAASRRLKARIAVIGVLSGVCFLGYNLMLALSYGFIFKTFQAEQLTDYNRYIYSYYIGWFILALGCLSVALLPQITVKGGADGPTAVFAATRRQPQAAFELFVLVLACGMLFRQSQLILPQLSVLGFADSEFTDRRAERAEAELVCSYLAPDDRVFYVGQGDNGEGWFSAVFDFYPILVDYSGTVTTDPDTGETKMIGGGGELGLPELQPAEGVKNTYYHGFTAQELDDIVRGNGCTVLYIQTLDDIFVQSYADLFTDKLAAAQSGETLLYRVTDAGFAPMPMEVERHELRRRSPHKPLQKLPKPQSIPQGLGSMFKAQISIFPPGKYQRPARFERGVSILRPLPMPLGTLCVIGIVLNLDLELLIDVGWIVCHDFIDCFLNFVGIFIVCELRRGLCQPHKQARRVIAVIHVILIPLLELIIRIVGIIERGQKATNHNSKPLFPVITFQVHHKRWIQERHTPVQSLYKCNRFATSLSLLTTWPKTTKPWFWALRVSRFHPNQKNSGTLTACCRKLRQPE